MAFKKNCVNWPTAILTYWRWEFYEIFSAWGWGSKILTAENNHLSVISVDDALKLLRNICSKKSTGMDKIPPKLTKKSKADH